MYLVLHYVGGFGVMGWVDVRELRDRSSRSSCGVDAEHRNADQVDSLIPLARVHTVNSVFALSWAPALVANVQIDWTWFQRNYHRVHG
jgi:hypothetical protein